MPRKQDPIARAVSADDIDPRYRWDRPLQAPGHMQVDFEERVDFRRLHAYRLGRARQALAPSGLGAVLVFDQYNIRYLSGTVIGEWARDKLTRWCLLTGNGEPWVWDFGSAARHHRLYAPQIPAKQSLAGMVGMRGAVSPKAGLFKKAAIEIRDILKAEGVAGMPLGIDVVEPPFLFALQELGLEVRDGQQVMLEARMLKSQDELTLLNMAAAMVDGVYQDIFEALKPGRARERDRGAGHQAPLRDGLGQRRGHQRDLGRALQPAPAQLHRPDHPPRRSGLLRHHHVLHRLPHLLLPHVQRGQGDQPPADGLQEGARVDGRGDRAHQARRDDRQDRQGLPQGAGHRLRQRDGRLRPELLPRHRPGPARAADHQPAELVRRSDGARRPA